jgi:hypothetical protein
VPTSELNQARWYPPGKQERITCTTNLPTTQTVHVRTRATAPTRLYHFLPPPTHQKACLRKPRAVPDRAALKFRSDVRTSYFSIVHYFELRNALFVVIASALREAIQAYSWASRILDCFGVPRKDAHMCRSHYSIVKIEPRHHRDVGAVVPKIHHSSWHAPSSTRECTKSERHRKDHRRTSCSTIPDNR